MRRLILPSLCALALACSNATPPSAPATFDRPEAVAFLCWALDGDPRTGGGPVSLENCTPRSTTGLVEDDNGEVRDGFALFALVTQTATGELAAVRLTNDPDGVEDRQFAGPVDSDERLPGFTFMPVGEVPSAVIVRERDPKRAYVANRGSSTLSVIDLAALRKGEGVIPETVALTEGARPSSMVLTPDEDALLVALPGLGQVARIPLDVDGRLGEVTYVDLSTDVPAPVDLTALPAGSLPSSYRYTCPADLALLEPPVTAPREPIVPSEPTPEPWNLLVDPVTGEVLVSDLRYPIVRRLDPTTLAEAAPITVSVPTRALALTPFVPATVDAEEATERYLYAIDAIDRSVLAVDVSDEARPTYGAVLPVSATAPTDRLELSGEARGVAVATPRYDADTATEPRCTDVTTDADRAGPASHYGVFLAVAALDGNVYLFDVYDRDTECRGLGCIDANDGTPNDDWVVIARHHPRIGVLRESGPILERAPTWDSYGRGTVEVAADGTAGAAADLVPTLEPVTCDTPLEAAFGDEARLCVLLDPYAAEADTITATFGGRIPFTSTSGANFEAGADYVDVRSDPCREGVIGRDQVAGDGVLAGYEGDRLVITGDLPPSILSREEGDPLRSRCEALVERTVSGATTPVQLPIVRAVSMPADGRPTYGGRLFLDDPLGDGGFTLDDVTTCYPELAEVEVRASNAFVVQSSRRGYFHPVVAGAGGECEVDPALAEAGLRGRALFGATFRSPFVTFALGERPPLLGTPVLSVNVTDVPSASRIDVSSIGGGTSSLLSRIVYNEVDERLYVVDQARVGLVRIRLTNLTVQNTFR